MGAFLFGGINMIKENEPDYIKRMHEELDTLGLRIERLKAF